MEGTVHRTYIYDDVMCLATCLSWAGKWTIKPCWKQASLVILEVVFSFTSEFLGS